MIDVTECPDCEQTGKYEGRILINGRGVYTCPNGHRWQDINEKPSNKGLPLRAPSQEDASVGSVAGTDGNDHSGSS